MKSTLKDYLKELDTTKSKIRSAFTFAYEKHSEQKRKSGEPYIEHCLEVYKNLKNWGVEDESLLIAALLHDVVEDTKVSNTHIRKKYGNEVAFLVENVTKVQDPNEDAKTLKKLVNGSYLNPKVAVLKLADRAHNLRTLQFMPEQKRYKKAQESLEVYSQLAEALGIWVVKNEFEDLSFKYLDFDRYAQIKNIIDQDQRIQKEFLTKYENILESILKDEVGTKDIQIKKASYYHIFKKAKLYSVQGVSEHDSYKRINDIVSFRVIVEKVSDCYKSLYLIHKFFGDCVDYDRLDEFIGKNKRDNGYEAIQTTIETEAGSIEIAIVTQEMENFNNWGFIYKLKIGQDLSEYKLKLLFTPKSDLVFLPLEANVLDFAYAINKRLGNDAVSAEVNGERKDLDYKLENGDTIKIDVGFRKVSNDEKLLIKCLPTTRKLLEKKISEKQVSDYIAQGKNLLEDHLSTRGILDLKDLDRDIYEIVYALGCETIDEIYYKIAAGYLDVARLDNLLNEFQITKNRLGWTTIKLVGKDRLGLLNKVTEIVQKCKGNIIKIYYLKDGESFSLRIVTEGIDSNSESKILSELKKEKSFERVLVV